MKRLSFRECWNAFVTWPFWGSFASACAKAWRSTIRWQGWRKLFFLPLFAVAPLFVLCGAALVWVFMNGLEQWPPVYGLYVLSAWLLSDLCVSLPAGIRDIKAWLEAYPKVFQMMKNEGFRFTLGLYFEQFVNFAYGIFKIISGVIVGSAWIGADGIYNFFQGVIQLFQILRRKRGGAMEQQWRSYRLCGILILLLHLTLTGIVFQMINWNRAEDHPGITIFATAAFAFYKIISSFIGVARDRKHTHPIDSSVRMLELSQAIFAIYSLQASLLHTFGTGEPWESWLNMATGCMVCLMVAAMGVYMIRRAAREIRKIQEETHG